MDVAIDPLLVRWSEPAESIVDRTLLVVLHGLGSNEDDLFGLAPLLPGDAVIASVRAPLPWGPGWAWFAAGPGAPDERQVGVATDALLSWLNSLPVAREIHLLGFSQGGAMALELLRRDPVRFPRVVVLAGFVALPASGADAAVAAVRPAVFWGRGDADVVIPADRIVAAADWLGTHTALEAHVYAGLPHSISIDEMNDVLAFLTLP